MPRSSSGGLKSSDSIEKLRAELSPRRQEIVRPMFDNPRDFVLLSIRAAAQKLGTDSAFLLRVVQQLGFSTYSDFKSYLQDLSHASTTSFERLTENSSKEVSLLGMLRSSIQASAENVAELHATLDAERVAHTARRLHKAQRIFVIGGDLASPVADYLSYQLTMLGLPPVTLHGTGETIHAMRAVTSKDVVIGITFRRGLRSTVEAMRDARALGAHCIALTNSSSTAVARFVDELFLMRVEGFALRASFIAPFAFVDALVAACAHLRRGRVLEILSDASEEQRHGYRWFNGEN